MSGKTVKSTHLRRERTGDQEPKLTEEQTDEVRTVFMLFDKDGDNTISVDHLGTVMRALGQYPTEEELAKLKADVCADGTEIVRFPEMCEMMARREWGFLGNTEELTEAFKVFDKTDDGFLRAGELRRALTSLGETLTEDELDVMMKSYPSDGDGMVRYDDFVKAMMQ